MRQNWISIVESNWIFSKFYLLIYIYIYIDVSPLQDDYLEDLIHREIFKDDSSSFIGTLETMYPFYDKAK